MQGHQNIRRSRCFCFFSKHQSQDYIIKLVVISMVIRKDRVKERIQYADLSLDNEVYYYYCCFDEGDLQVI